MLLLAVAAAAYAAAGGLDPNFSGDGKVTTDLSTRGDFAAAVAVQADGKVVVAGSAAYDTTDAKWALTRYKVGGAIDTSFGGGDGKVITNFTSGEDAVYGLAIQSDGKIVAAGDAGGSAPAIPSSLSPAMRATEPSMRVSAAVTGRSRRTSPPGTTKCPRSPFSRAGRSSSPEDPPKIEQTRRWQLRDISRTAAWIRPSAATAR
jgi:uncharacterized delta-60 repeat protein